MRVAAIDCGTNSIRLLVADASPDGLHDLHREMRIVRLGADVDRTGSLSAPALERTRIALADYAATVADLAADRVRMVATSATRDADNRADFAAVVRATLHIEPEVVTGAEEAALSYAGAVGSLPAVDGLVLLADLGGGSTELVLGNGRLRVHSMDVGSVRMTERHLRDDPPTAAQIEAAVRDIRGALATAAADVPLNTGARLVGVAGTITTIAAIALDLPEYRPEVVHGSVITAAEVAEVTDRLLRLPHERRAAIPTLHPGRVDVICGGALVLRTLVEATGAPEIVASEHDILDGIALSLL
jgi:exopolyphosphatase/guanosine-5'-triphosphate,3'-diphosphate pyrophosphatase